MIGTLVTHEVRRTWKPALTLIGGSIVISGLGFLGAITLSSPLGTLCGVLGLVVGLLCPFATLLGLGVDFYRTAYARNGYLTAALPVRGATIYWVKFGYAYVVGMISILVGGALAILGYVCINIAAGVSGPRIRSLLESAMAVLGGLPFWVQAAIVLVVLLMPASSLAQYYVAVTVGSQGALGRMGLSGVVLMWFAYYVATQVVGVVGLLMPPNLVLSDPAHPSLSFEPFLFFNPSLNDSAVPLMAIVLLYALAFAAIWLGKVSYDRRLELR